MTRIETAGLNPGPPRNQTAGREPGRKVVIIWQFGPSRQRMGRAGRPESGA